MVQEIDSQHAFDANGTAAGAGGVRRLNGFNQTLLGEDDFVRDLKSLNQKAAEPASFPADFTKRVEEIFGLESHASRLAVAFEGLFTQDCDETTTENISSRLLDLFFRPRYHRPLIGGW